MRPSRSMPELHCCECVLYANKTKEAVASKGQDVSLLGEGVRVDELTDHA